MSCSTGSSSRFNANGERHNADIHAFIDGIEEVKDRLTKARVRTHTQALLTRLVVEGVYNNNPLSLSNLPSLLFG